MDDSRKSEKVKDHAVKVANDKIKRDGDITNTDSQDCGSQKDTGCLESVHAVMSMCACHEGKVCLTCYENMTPLQQSVCPVCNSMVIRRQPFCLPSAEQHNGDTPMKVAIAKTVRTTKKPKRRRLFPPMRDRSRSQIPVQPARDPDDDEMAAAREAQEEFEEW